MNIVIYSYNFLPQADPESYCATRFASALARAGHNVTVVTMDWSMQVSKENYDALVAKELKIVRVPFSTKKNTPLKGLLIYGHKSQMAVDVPESVKAVKYELKSMDSPILVTRSLPVASAMVGLKSYKYATKWVAHFSDPVPWEGYAKTIGHRLLRRLEKNIVKRSLNVADGISITCDYVNNYFKEEYPKVYNRNKNFKITHIADNRLNDGAKISIKENPNVLLHSGFISKRRGGLVIKQVMNELQKENFSCIFVQVGQVDNEIKGFLVDAENVKVYDEISLEKSLELCSQAKVDFVPDTETSLAYSPFLPSKFVYRLMEEKPIVVYSSKTSELYDYAMKYPEAGIFWAEMGNKESLKSAIKSAMSSDTETFDRTQIRKCFAEETIAEEFVKAVNRL